MSGFHSTLAPDLASRIGRRNRARRGPPDRVIVLTLRERAA
jgi:hypothetical protein